MKKINIVLSSLFFLAFTSCNFNFFESNEESISASEKESVIESVSEKESVKESTSVKESVSEKENESVSESESPSETESSSESSGESIEAYKVTFDVDEHVSVSVYSSQDYTTIPVEAEYAYSLDSTNFEYTTTDGQVNFLLVFESGYVLDSMQADDNNYKNIKGPSDTEVDNVYRITKITGDFTLSITSKLDDAAIDAYKVSFVCDDYVTVYVYSSQDYTTTPVEVDYAYSLDKTKFEYTKVEGQVNFLLVFEEGYELDTMVASENNYKNIKGSDETEVDNVYRITKITGDFTLTISSKEK